MAKVILRSNFTSGSIPTPAELEASELVLGIGDGRLWTKNQAGNIMLLNPPQSQSQQSVSSSYAVTSSAATSITFVPVTASYALTANAVPSVSASWASSSISASYATTSSYASLAQNVLGSITSASYALTASHAEYSKTAGTSTSASFATTASAATSITFTPATSSYAVTSSHAEYAKTVGSVTSASFATTASAATSITFTPTNATSASYALTASFAANATTPVSTSFATTASAATSITFTPTSASYASTSSYMQVPSYMGLTVGASGSSIPLGYQGTVQVPSKLTLQAVRIVSTDSSSIHWDVRQHTSYATFSTTGGTSLTGSGTPPSMSNNAKYEDTSLTNWTTSVDADAFISFHVNAVAGGDNDITTTILLKVLRN